MIRIERFVCNMLQENCYVLSDESGECVVVDCGAWFENERKAIVNYTRDNHLTPKHLLFDCVYNPEDTLFLQKGRAQGATVKNGLEMLHLQAMASWRFWNE